MKNFAVIPCFVFFSFFLVISSCKKSDDEKKDKETILKGSVTILVDETIKPIIEDQIEVFENFYPAKIIMDARSEKEVVRSLINDSSSIAVLSRKLTAEENKIFDNKKIIPKVTFFATDGIALISNKNNKDTLVALNDIIAFMKGQPQNGIKGLVFDNPNSSTVRYMNDLAGIKESPEKGIFSFKTNEEVIKFVSENEGMIGVVGLNWLYQPSGVMKDIVKKVKVLSVKSTTGNEFYPPSQNNIAEGKYPLARDLYIINCQGSSGLGMGFASFVAGEQGQRVVLKSGLLPFRTPSRKIKVRKGIYNDKK
ncbi:phosphate ABC transporter substrate-binding protein (PhoT family) [Flavobacterium limicola]|uniref:Phosphate ABC transporter substrate-binding protein (PhoT family) n=1 Tax=Flavobacterium limicola TaxID=180441 RepID=A0A495S486_9FLAO|nr:substrate-binding domain-containing protein [Flavobacterium limicola]RKS94409.1 phosphate ABC transporter substrate-binding protein (PhoT family) [Flavobacterium limicola]